MENRVSSRVQRVTGLGCSGFTHIRVTGSPEPLLGPPDFNSGRRTWRIGPSEGSGLAHGSTNRPGFLSRVMGFWVPLGIIGFGSAGNEQHHPLVNQTSERLDFPPPPSGLQLTDPPDPFFSTSLSISQPHLSVSLSIPDLNSLSLSLSLDPSLCRLSLCLSGRKRKKKKRRRKKREREEKK
jgi:hypothetical protein